MAGTVKEILFDLTGDTPTPPRPTPSLTDNSTVATRKTLSGDDPRTGLTTPPAGNRIIYNRYINDSDLLERYNDGENAPSLSITFTNTKFTTETFERSYLFCDVTGGDDMLGGLGEFIVIFGQLNELDRYQIEGYLAWKWGLVGNLPPSHPYKLVAPSGPPWEVNCPSPSAIPSPS